MKRRGTIYRSPARKPCNGRTIRKAWHDLSEQLLSLGHTDEAEAAARHALALEPEHLGAATTLGNILLNQGDLDEASALFLRLEADGTSPPHVTTALAAIACRQGRVNEALERLEAVVTTVPGHVMARLYLARALDLAGRAAEAREQLDALRNTAPRLIEVQQRLQAHELRTTGENQARHGDAQSALAAFVAALKLDPEDPLLHLDVGVVAAALGQTEGADRSFARASRLAASLAGIRAFL